MGSPVHTAMSSFNCSHGGTVSITPTQMRVKIGGQPVLISDDTFTPMGCPLNVSSAPQPCTTLRWVTTALRVKVGGKPILTASSQALSIGPTQAPQGSPIVVNVQTRVSAT